MNWDVFTKLSPPEIQLHWATATIAFFLGLIIFLRPKGTLPHKTMGVFYATLMIVTSVSAFFIRRGEVTGLEFLTFKGMTFIHLFIPVTLIGIVGGLHGILIRKDAEAHRKPLIGSFIGGLIIAGGLTFIPGRRMYSFFFDNTETIQRLIEVTTP